MLSRRFLSVFASTAALGALAFLSYPASATVIDDPQIFIQQSGSSPAGGDPNTITNPGSFVVGVAGNFTLQNPLLIIVGVYDGNGTPSITYGGGVSVAPLGTYGLTADTASSTAASVGTGYDQRSRSLDERNRRVLPIAIIRRCWPDRPDRQPVVAVIDRGMMPSGRSVPTRCANERDARQHVSRFRTAHSRSATPACRVHSRARPGL